VTRLCALFAAAAFWLAAPPGAAAVDLGGPGLVLMMRHAYAPGTGDPPGMRVEDCATQRNLDGTGRAQARATGERLRAAGVAPARVLSSQWCRCLETARLLGLGPVETAPAALNSFFADRAAEARHTAALRALLDGMPRDGAPVVLVTHMVNITALTEIVPASGEIVALRLAPGGGFAVLGRLAAARS
jgi:broad specificity phosphatase PhoE